MAKIRQQDNFIRKNLRFYNSLKLVHRWCLVFNVHDARKEYKQNGYIPKVPSSPDNSFNIVQFSFNKYSSDEHRSEWYQSGESYWTTL